MSQENTPQNNNESKISNAAYLLKTEEMAGKIAFSTYFWDWLLKPDGSPINPDFKPCLEAEKKLKNLTMVGTAQTFPKLTEKTAIELLKQFSTMED